MDSSIMLPSVSAMPSKVYREKLGRLIQNSEIHERFLPMEW